MSACRIFETMSLALDGYTKGGFAKVLDEFFTQVDYSGDIVPIITQMLND
jgi:hypothetical protein